VTFPAPKFSVVIPTYNRGHLLALAVQSVLAQTFDSFEIVVSNGGSTDNTREVVEGFDDPRIKYFESKERLAIGDNYQKGLDEATGEYITFLSDDDAYVPTLLEQAKQIIDSRKAEIVVYEYCRYYHSETDDFGMTIPANSLLIDDSDSTVTEFSRDEALLQILISSGLKEGARDPHFTVPYLSNAVYHRSIFDKLKNKRPKLFDFVPPDMYLAAAVFFHVERVCCFDKPLLVWSNWDGNATATASRTPNQLLEHYRRLMDGRGFQNVPVNVSTAFNCGAECIIEAYIDDLNGDVPVDWTTYFIKMWENFSFLRSQGVTLDNETVEFENALSRQPEIVQNRVNEARDNLRFRGKAFLNENLSVIARIARRLMKGSATGFSIRKGTEYGFSDILGASRCVEEVIKTANLV